MNDPHLIEAARLLMKSEPELARLFTLAQLEEHLRILAKRLRLAGELEKVAGT